MTQSGGDLGVTLVSGREIKRVADRLREIDKKAPNRLRKELRAVARDGAKDVKGRARKLPAKGARGGTTKHPHKRRQLRRQVAKGVKVQASTGGRRGAGLRIVTTMPTKEEALLPRGLDSQWRHPVFGDKEKWVEQDGSSWFREPLAGQRPEIDRRIRGVIEGFVQEIASAGGG
ncbi:hypothetical protein ACF07Q_28590 [Nocardiopsis dassonvillei]|uniref:hypothetical protein n=1 Tax=Nocardiopsis dassonvillei TaxID=2014 RepID=UPI0036FBF259